MEYNCCTVCLCTIECNVCSICIVRDAKGSVNPSNSSEATTRSILTPCATMQVADGRPAVRLINENGDIIHPKQLKIVPLSSTPNSGILPSNIVRSADGTPFVLKLVSVYVVDTLRFI